MSDLLNCIVDYEIIITAVGLLVFAFSYMVFFNWTKTAAGRSLLYFVLSLLGLVSVSVIRVFTDSQSDAFILARGLVYTVLVFTTWHLVFVLWTNYRRLQAKNSPHHLPPLKVPAKNPSSPPSNLN